MDTQFEHTGLLSTATTNSTTVSDNTTTTADVIASNDAFRSTTSDHAPKDRLDTTTQLVQSITTRDGGGGDCDTAITIDTTHTSNDASSRMDSMDNARLLSITTTITTGSDD